ncbi:MAG: ABC transporter substrate-binding protein [Firmicutes bacterium]|nr:ABC transporter substrate-binding protein [Bacillota bacterium]
MKRGMAAVLVLGLGVLAGCGNAPGGTGGGDEKVVRIGLIAPLTGDVKTFGESTKNAFELALEQAGYKAGDFTIQHFIQDDRNDPTEAMNIATKLITEQKVHALVGSVSSKATISVSDVANQSRVVHITGTATNIAVTVDEKGNRKPFVFRACFTDPFQGQVAAKFALETLGARTAAVLYDKGNDYSVGLAESFRQHFEAGGGEVVAWEAYALTDTDFSAILTKVADAKPDLLYLPDYYQKVSLIGKQARAKGITATMMGGDGWDSSELDFATMAGGYFTNHYSPEDTRPEVQQFVTDYQAKYGSVPDALAVLAYDATNILLEGIRRANSNDPDQIRQAIQNLKEFKAVSGQISFDENGNPVKPAAILQVQGDKTTKFIASVNP